jgi:hypothetical protein
MSPPSSYQKKDRMVKRNIEKLAELYFIVSQKQRRK